jgi:hypothetical protein
MLNLLILKPLKVLSFITFFLFSKQLIADTIADITKNFVTNEDKSIYIHPNIDQKKLLNFKNKIKDELKISFSEEVFVYVDHTVFGSGDVGLILTNDKLISNFYDFKGSYNLALFKNVTFEKGFMADTLKIQTQNNQTLTINFHKDVDGNVIADIFKEYLEKRNHNGSNTSEQSSSNHDVAEIETTSLQTNYDSFQADSELFIKMPPEQATIEKCDILIDKAKGLVVNVKKEIENIEVSINTNKAKITSLNERLEQIAELQLKDSAQTRISKLKEEIELLNKELKEWKDRLDELLTTETKLRNYRLIIGI